jgi:tetratricopeptide (TPR) repeat protein
MGGYAIRGALVLLALLAGAYLALGLHQVRLIDDGDAVLAKARAGKVPTAQVDAALDQYDKARKLNPDPTPLIHSAELMLATGRTREANEFLFRALHDEPDNVEAWFAAYVAADGNTFARNLTRRKLLALNPWFLYVLTGRSPS